ncbi:hypothetical protein QFZ96_006128 [Paraburkholderia youngii]
MAMFGRKFLGYSLWVASGGVIKRKVATKPLLAFKRRIRELTGRNGGRSMKDVVERLRPYVLGWKAYAGWRKRHESGWGQTSGCVTGCVSSSLSDACAGGIARCGATDGGEQSPLLA